jgi:hypothetical protein
MSLHIARGSPARRLIDSSPARPLVAEAAAGLGSAAAAPDDRTLVLPAAADAGAAAAPAPAAVLRQSLREVQQAVAAGQVRLNDLLHRVLETLQTALQCRCVVFCLRDPRSGLLTGRFGLGAAAGTVSAALRIDPARARQGDMFAALCVRGADTLISDATTPAMLQRLPTWYRGTVNAPTFLLLPLMHKGAPVGLIYADKAQADSLRLGADELALVKALRDQVLLVFAKGAGG